MGAAARDRLARRASTTCFVLAAATVLGAAAGDALFGRAATVLLRANDAAERDEQRALRDPRDDVAEIYGRPVPGVERVLLFDRSRWIVPREAPERSLVLLRDAREHGTSPLRWWLGASMLAFLLAVAGGMLRRSREGPATLPRAAAGE